MNHNQYLLQEILLNRVEGLTWYYFQVDLSKRDLLDSPMSFVDLAVKLKRNKKGIWKHKGDPIEPTELFSIVSRFLRRNPEVATVVLKRIFDTNLVANKAAIEEGLLGRLNLKETKRRSKQYDKVRKKEYPIRSNRKYVILAEGDSWFQFPRIYGISLTRDILNHLAREKQFLLKTLASAGDWLSNLLRAGDYIEELPKLNPDVLLISGGGNDLVGADRIAQMVSVPSHNVRTEEFQLLMDDLFESRSGAPDFKEHIYKDGQKFIEEEFIDFLNIVFIQYYLLFNALTNMDKYANMLIFTHGYDYCYPRLKTRGNGLLLSLYEKLSGYGGRWLSLPLSTKGIDKEADQKAIIYFMIHEFNELLIPLAQNFKNLYHIDCRGVAPEQTDWIDELHLKAGKYKMIADKIKACILDEGDLRSQSVIPVIDKVFSCQI